MCSRSNTISAGYVASGWACHSRPTVWLYVRSMLWASRWVCPLSGVTFEPCHVLPWAWQEVKGEAASVDEADYRR